MRRTNGRARLACAALCLVPGLALGGAAAATAAPMQQSFKEVVKPSDSITVPDMQCPRGSYLENVDHSPGRIVPRGVQVTEPGGVGVTIPEANWENTSTGVYATGSRQGTATNWDPVTPHELTVTLHCTTDLTKAFKQTERLGPRG
ncbi:hypothetical protein ABZZ17_09020 [Streptomyces sp. NPDC006512]|uniref:hypothetical protein n=1 Tax=Streptomyces sp. NPDC006512 TaxID=3154307 RepID=UPI0033AA0665